MGSAGEGGTEVRIGYDGRTCFTVGFGGRGGFGGLRVITDGVRQLAVYGSGGGVVHCLDDQKDYSLDPARPKCAPWVGPTGLTMVQPAFLCESTVPGDCAISP